MFNLNQKRGFKAVAITCAVLLTCANTQIIAGNLSNTSYIVSAETISKTEVNSDGCLILHLDTTTSDSVTVTFTGGKAGATTSGEVGYYDKKWISQYDSWKEKKFDDNGSLTVTVKVPKGVSDVQILLTYYADWSSGKENKLDVKTLKYSLGGSGSTGTGTTTTTTGSGSSTKPSQSMPDNAECNWSEIDNTALKNSNTKNLKSESVSNGKKTVSLVQGGQWSSYDEGQEPIILDQTWKPEVEGQYDTDSGNDKITNSNNFGFYNDFGVPTNANIDHFRFTFQSDEPMYQVQIGAGISVKKDSEIANSGSTDANGNMNKIWFNESGTFDPENEDDYASLENSNGKKYYGYNRGKEVGKNPTNYLQLQWNVSDDVKPYIQNDSWSSVSVQYWYGVDPADWDKIDWENPPENPDVEHKPTQINVTEASCIYDIDETYDYTDTATSKTSQTATVGGEMVGVKLSDLGLGENDTPKAVTVKLKADSDIGKLLCGFGVSVSDNYTGDLDSANFYKTANLVYEECSDTYEVTWVIPSDISKYVEPEYDAEVKFGVWDARVGEDALSTIEVQEISVDYYSEEVTTTTTPTTTTSVTTTTPIKDGIKGDKINVNMGPIDPADDDETSPTFHQFSIEPITDILPKDYNPTTDDIAQIIFEISSPEEMKDITAACGIAVSKDCKDATDDYWYQGKDFKVSDSGKKATITWTVPENIREYVQENQYGKVNLGIWYAGEGVDEVYLDNVQVVYTSKKADDTTTTTTTTASVTTTTTSNSQTTTTPKITTTTTSKTSDDKTTTTTTKSSDTDRVWGDANCDGKVKVNDIQIIRQYILHMIDDEFTEEGRLNADVTHDNTLRVNDIQLIRQYILHMISEEDLAPKN